MTETDTEVQAQATEQAYPLGNLKGIVGFRRVVQVRPYETAEAKVDLEVSIDLDADGAATIAALNDAFFQAKAVVFDQLGIDFEVGEGGVVVELVRKEFGGGELTGPAASSPPSLTVVGSDGASVSDGPASASSVSATPPFSGDTRDKDERKANKAWAQARFDEHPDEFYDNRAKKAAGEYSPKSPDYKHIESGVGIWSD